MGGGTLGTCAFSVNHDGAVSSGRMLAASSSAPLDIDVPVGLEAEDDFPILARACLPLGFLLSALPRLNTGGGSGMVGIVPAEAAPAVGESISMPSPGGLRLRTSSGKGANKGVVLASCEAVLGPAPVAD